MNRFFTKVKESIKWKLPIFILVGLFGVGWFGFKAINLRFERNLVDQLQAIHKNSLEALKLWVEEEKALVDIWSKNEVVRHHIEELVELTKGRNDWEPEELIKSKPLQKLRKILGSVTDRLNFIGFVITDKEGFQIGALLDEPIGKKTLISRSRFIQKALQKKTIVSLPFFSEAALPDIEGVWHKKWPTMFSAAPVFSKVGEVIGVLAFRIRPELDFTRILEVGRFGETGETYAFNSSGLMISDSRFNTQLKKTGLISDSPGSRAILNVDIRNPEVNLTEGLKSNVLRKKQPLTFMADSAIFRKGSINVDGYNDYRGVPVVGAWTWLSEYDFGVATEIDTEEAYSPLRYLLWLFAALFSLLLIAYVEFVRQQVRKLNEEDRKNVQYDLTKVLAESKNIEEAIPNILRVFVSHPNWDLSFYWQFEPKSNALRCNEGFCSSKLSQEEFDLFKKKSFNTFFEKEMGLPGRIWKTGKPSWVEDVSTDSNFPRAKEAKKIDIRTAFGFPVYSGGKFSGVFEVFTIGTVNFDKDLKVFFEGIGTQIGQFFEKKQAEIKLRDTKEQLQSILESAGEGIYGLDLNGCTTFANRAAEKMLGYSFEYMKGRSQHELIHHSKLDGETLPNEECNIFAAFKFGKISHVENEVFWKKNGASFPVEYVSAPILSEDEKIMGAVVIFKDITNRKKMEQERTDLIKNLRVVNKELEEFSYRTSHDLKAPLVNIRGLSSIMKMDMEDGNYEEVISNLEKVGGLTQKLESLMSDILELSKIDHIEDKFEEIDIKKELQSIKENLSTLIEEKQVKMNFNFKGVDSLYTSKSLINTVLENLISNAIKYSDPDKNNRFVKVEILKEKAGIYIRVCDNGLGIPQKHMSGVFGMFKRFHKNTSFGSGLGLYIVKKNIQKINGEISVKSDAEGTVFTVFLPEKSQRPN